MLRGLDSNQRPSAYETDKLSLLHLAICWGSWIRTTEVERRQIYSLLHLTALENLNFFLLEHQDSNLG